MLWSINNMYNFPNTTKNKLFPSTFIILFIDLHLFVRFLYIIRYPHSRQRMGSRGLISFSWWHSEKILIWKQQNVRDMCDQWMMVSWISIQFGSQNLPPQTYIMAVFNTVSLELGSDILNGKEPRALFYQKKKQGLLSYGDWFRLVV